MGKEPSGDDTDLVKIQLEGILRDYDGHFAAPADTRFINDLLGKIWQGTEGKKLALEEGARHTHSDEPFSLRDYDHKVLERIVAHAEHLGDTGNVGYLVGESFMTPEQLSHKVAYYMDTAGLNNYIHKDDYSFLSSVNEQLTQGKRLSAKQVILVEGVLEKADQRKANVDMGAIYFDPEGAPLIQKRGVYREGVGEQGKRLLNFLLYGKMDPKAISEEDLLRARDICYDKQKGIVALSARLMLKKTAEEKAGKTVRNFDEYRRALTLLEAYLGAIDPNMHNSYRDNNGLIYFKPKGPDMPFPDA